MKKVVDIEKSSKFEFKPDNNPPPGLYDADAAILNTLPRSPSAKIIKDSKCSTARILNTAMSSSPDPYTGHLKPFGAECRNIVFGSSCSPDKPNENPPPGMYDSNLELIKPKIPGGPYISHADDYEDRNYGGDPVNMSV